MAAPSGGNRFLKLAGMTASLTSKAVRNTLTNYTGSEEQKAAAKSEMYAQMGKQIAATLGEMKGAVMKVGQMLSQFQDVLPPEIAEAFTTLQREAPPMPFAQIKHQVEIELKNKLSNIYSEFDELPFAAASIGQVHRARLLDGTPVVVKVQYPGVDAACQGDLKQIKLALRLSGLVKVSREAQDKMFTEFENTLNEELDYTLEAHNLQVFTAFHKQLDPKIIIPSVYSQYSSRRVLTLTEEKGSTIAEAATWDQSVRNELGRRIFTLMGDQMFLLNTFHCDPHPGNFAFRPDGSLVVYDFGGVKELTPAIVNSFKLLIQSAIKGNMQGVEQSLTELEIKKGTESLPASFYQPWIEALLSPIIKPCDFAQCKVHMEVIPLVKDSLKYHASFQPSPHTLMSNRAVSGHYWNMIALKVNADFSDLVAKYTA